MTQKIEELSATGTVIGIVAPLAEFGDATLPAGTYALTFEQDEMSAIIGTAEEIAALLDPIRIAISSISEHAARPLSLTDFVRDDEGDYVCPKCGDYFRPSQTDNIGYLVNAIHEHIGTHRPEHEVTA